jgi:hypothetical protein
MVTPSKKSRKAILNGIKLFIASISVTSLIGLWNLFAQKEESLADAELNSPEPIEENLLNNPLPTLVSSMLDNDVSEGSDLPMTQVTPPAAQPTPEPVVERVVIGSSGGSGGGSSSTRTSSSR